jgi:hypothetical protein
LQCTIVAVILSFLVQVWRRILISFHGTCSHSGAVGIIRYALQCASQSDESSGVT